LGKIFPLPVKGVKFLLSCLLLLTLFDLVATVYWISAGLAIEANPILARIIEKSYIFFAATKFSFVFVGIFLLDKFKTKRNRLIFHASLSMVLIYVCVALWHISGLFNYLL